MQLLSFYAGAGITAIGGAAGTYGVRRLVNRTCGTFSNMTKAVISNGACMASLMLISAYIEETSPFWKGVSDAIPIAHLLSGTISGMYVREGMLEPELVQSPEFIKQRQSTTCSHIAQLGLSIIAIRAIPHKEVASTAAVWLGVAIGSNHIDDASEKAKKALLKVD